MTRFDFIVQEERPVTNEDEDDDGRLEARITLSIGEARFWIPVHILSRRSHPTTSLSARSDLCAVLTILFLQQIDRWMMNVTVWRFHTYSARS